MMATISASILHFETGHKRSGGSVRNRRLLRAEGGAVATAIDSVAVNVWPAAPALPKTAVDVGRGHDIDGTERV